VKLWGQLLVGNEPWGSPFALVAEPATEGRIAISCPERIELEAAPCGGMLAIEVHGAHGFIGRFPVANHIVEASV
jgi:hypothetical protein